VNENNIQLKPGISSYTATKIGPVEIASYLIIGAALWFVLKLRLLDGLIAGLFVFQLIHLLAPPLEKQLSGKRARWLAVMLLSIIITGALAAIIIAVVSYFQRHALSAQAWLERLMVIIDGARDQLPVWVQGYLPDGIDELHRVARDWLKAHLSELQQGGKSIARSLTRITIGMIIAAMIAVGATWRAHRLPLAQALVTRIGRFSQSFRRIVFAQLKISLINATATGIYLLLILPLFGIQLPLAKLLVVITFVVGLLPVIGNLISNTLIVVISLSTAGLMAAVASLVFLIVIHKLEYFLNANIIGIEIKACAWELLLAMVVMEASFGLPGIIAAPIYYAYLKRELVAARLV
jgi:predicted PurR-regulated permease PerM